MSPTDTWKPLPIPRSGTAGLRETAVIITKDEDFALRKTLNDTGPAVVWIRLPNTRRPELLARSEIALPDVLWALERGEGLIEVI